MPPDLVKFLLNGVSFDLEQLKVDIRHYRKGNKMILAQFKENHTNK
jgi:hypothetical protein